MCKSSSYTYQLVWWISIHILLLGQFEPTLIQYTASFIQILPLWGRDEHEFPDDELWSGAGNPRVRSCQGSVRSRILHLDPNHPIGLLVPIIRPYVGLWDPGIGNVEPVFLKTKLRFICRHCFLLPTLWKRGARSFGYWISFPFASKSEYNSWHYIFLVNFPTNENMK